MSRNEEFDMASGTPQAPGAEKDGIVLTPAQEKNRRARNVAIGVAIALFMALFYLVTIVKLGGAVARPPV
jgi:hypothetical protein